MREDWIDLNLYPGGRTEAIRSIRTRVHRSNATLLIAYQLEGDIERLHIPAPRERAIGRELWRHTCFEAFIKIGRAAAYHEFNFAPSREWTVYAFSGYRNGAALTDESMNPEIDVRIGANRIELDAVVRLDRLSPLHPDAALRLGLAAVIESIDGLSYWAIRHPADKPDFHDPEGFAMLLEPPNHAGG